MGKKLWMVITSFIVAILLEVYVRFICKMLYGEQLYILWPPIDNITHFVWGFTFFLAFLLLFKWDLPDSILGSFFFHMIWEAFEIMGDQLFPQPNMIDHFFFDGVMDTLMFIIGGCVTWALLARRYTSQQPGKLRAFFEKYLYTSIFLVLIGGSYYIWTIINRVEFKSPDVFALTWIISSATIIGIYEAIKQSMPARNVKTRKDYLANE